MNMAAVCIATVWDHITRGSAGSSLQKHCMSHHNCTARRKKFFANSSFLIFRTANRNGKALQIPKVQLMRHDTGVREVKGAFPIARAMKHSMMIARAKN
jgi:hypothetical protein